MLQQVSKSEYPVPSTEEMESERICTLSSKGGSRNQYKSAHYSNFVCFMKLQYKGTLFIKTALFSDFAQLAMS